MHGSCGCISALPQSSMASAPVATLGYRGRLQARPMPRATLRQHHLRIASRPESLFHLSRPDVSAPSNERWCCVPGVDPPVIYAQRRHTVTLSCGALVYFGHHRRRCLLEPARFPSHQQASRCPRHAARVHLPVCVMSACAGTRLGWLSRCIDPQSGESHEPPSSAPKPKCRVVPDL